jgi:PAS domain S-box-containing protein
MSPPDQASPPLPRQVGEGLVGLAFEARAPLWLNQYGAWSGGLDSAKQAGVVAGIAAPLMIGDETLGIIVARKTGPGERVDEEDAQVLGLLATHAAVGVANARAYAHQREAADRAASRAAELEALLESMTDGVLLVDEGGRVTSANRAAATILGREPGTLAKASLPRLLNDFRMPESGDDLGSLRPAALALALHAARSEWELVGEVRGNKRVLALVGMPVGGQTNGTLLVLRDVTDRRHSEERAAQAEKLRALGQLASGVAHDVNNILAAVLGRAELARMEVERGEIEPGRLLEALGQIEQAAEDGARTVRRIQEFARVRTDADVTVVDLSKLIRDTVELTRPSWRNADQTADSRVALDLDLTADLLVAAEPLELREVLTNLIFNAVDAMPRGGSLRIGGRCVDGMVRIDVSDTGVGMSREVSRRVFEPFFTTKVEGGTGLGLAVAYGIVRRRGGHLTVASVPDGGTTFTIELPYAGDPTAAPSAVTAVRSLPDRRRHILFADDEAGLASIVQRLLLIEGFDVTICTGGEDALAQFDPLRHDLVLTDYGMPDINGVQVAAAVRRASPTTPVVLITGWGSDLDAGTPPPGVSAVIGKPFRLAALVETVRSALAGAAPTGAEHAQTDIPDPAPSG